MPLALFALTTGAFGIAAADFVTMGLLLAVSALETTMIPTRTRCAGR